MARRQRLSETQIAELFDPPTEPRELVRHYTLSETDLVAIARCRGDHNRLGHARHMPRRLPVANRLISVEDQAKPFLLCPLMLQEWAVRQFRPSR